MVTLSSCLIWQITSFTLPPNKYGCVYVWTTLGSGPAIDLQKMAILAKKIIFSDEAHFDLGGYVNKQNCRIWGTENPQAYIEQPTHPKQVNVWCRVERIFVHKNWRVGYWQHLVSTGRRYVPHSRSYTRCFAACFRKSHYQPQSWCRLATSELRFDIYLWGAAKEKCYADKPETIDALKGNIPEAIGEIQLHTIDNVLKY